MVQKHDNGIWWVTGSSVKGATHYKSGLPNQDAIRMHSDTRIVVLSIADGHGSEKYFRSEIGAKFAVEVADEVLRHFGEGQASVASLSVIEDSAKRLPWQIVSQWKQKVEQHWKGEKRYLNEREEEWQKKKENVKALETILANPSIAYGATLLTVLLTDRFILYLQLGDGDILTVAADGSVDEPVPGDERNLANETTSLCDPKATGDFRMQFQRLVGEMPALIMLSTDGYSNSFREREGFHKVGSDIWQLIRSKGEDGLKTVEDSLEGWLSRATQTGSGDDITVGLLCRLSALQEEGRKTVPSTTPAQKEDNEAKNPSFLPHEITNEHGLPGQATKIRQSTTVSGQEGDALAPTHKKGKDPVTQKLPEGENRPSPVGASSQRTTDVVLPTQTSLDDNGWNSPPSIQFGNVDQAATIIMPSQKPSEVKEDVVPVGPPSAPKLPPQVLTVSKENRQGHYKSIVEAIKDAKPHAEIRVRPGVYNEKSSIDIKKPISIIGEGRRDEIIVRISVPCIQMLIDDDALVQGISIQGMLKSFGSTGKENPAIAISQGHLELRDCSITSASIMCVKVDGSQTSPHIINCDIYREPSREPKDSREIGLVFNDHAKGTVENCHIYNHHYANVKIDFGSNPILSNCEIYDGQCYGILAWWNCQSTIKNCKIFGNSKAGIIIANGGDPTIQECEVHHSECGISVINRGKGTIKDCKFTDHIGIGIEIRQESDPKIIRCIISNSTRCGILVDALGRGDIKYCDIEGCVQAGIEIRAQSTPRFHRCKVFKGQAHGIYIADKGTGIINDCQIVNNARTGIVIRSNSRALIHKCTITEGKSYGVKFLENSTGNVENCFINLNANFGIDVRGRSFISVQNCDMRGNERPGIFKEEGSIITERGSNLK